MYVNDSLDGEAKRIARYFIISCAGTGERG